MIQEPITAVIVDDEQPSRAALANYLAEFCPNIRVLAECNSADHAYQVITALSPQLVFLDVEMPRGNGFELLKMFGDITFNVIFITAFSEYAIQAFRFSATDYLLKPIKVSELIEAVNKAVLELQNSESYLNLRTLVGNMQKPGNQPVRLVISDTKGFSVINFEDLFFCEAKGYCTLFFVKGNTVISSSRNLKYYEELLPTSQFMRVHHSFLINLQHVKGYLNTEEILLTENQKVPLSSSGKKAFLEYFKRLK